MYTAITRTSFAFPTQFYNRLMALSKRRKLTLAKTVQILVEPILVSDEEKTRQRVYAAFDRVQGLSKAPINDASGTIDTLLYGERKDGK